MDSLYIGPFSASDIDVIHRAMKAQLDNIEDFLDPTEDDAVAFLVEQSRVGRIIDRIEHIQLSL